MVLNPSGVVVDAKDVNPDGEVLRSSRRTQLVLISFAVLYFITLTSVAIISWHILRTESKLNDLQADINEMKLIITPKENKSSEATRSNPPTNPVAQDCLEHYLNGQTTSGSYTILPPGGSQTRYDVHCDMDMDGGGWIVFQRRVNGSVNFTKDWQSYKDGLRDASHEFWIGNDVLHDLTSFTTVDLRIDMWSWENEHGYAKYSNFTVGDITSNYMLQFQTYQGGNAGDALTKQNTHAFATHDRDPEGRGCPSRFPGGAWWYSSCFHSNLNGKYSNESTVPEYAIGIIWNQWKGFYYSLKQTEMKLRRNTLV